jgi:GWxTD domain-containing protein
MKNFQTTHSHHFCTVIPTKAGIQFFIFFLLLLHLTGNTMMAGEDIPARSSGDLDFYLDHTIFNQKNTESFYCEFYLMLYAAQIEGKMSDNDYIGKIKIHSKLKNLNTGDKSERRWQTNIKMDQDHLRNKTLAIYDQWADYLEPASYEIDVTVSDLNSDKQGRAILNITANPGDLHNNISHIQFVSGIEKSNIKDQFYKSGRKIQPNPSRRYGVLSPKLYFYYEIYAVEELIGEHFNLVYSIIGEIDSLSRTYPVKQIKIPGKALSVVHGIDISNYPSGIYRLKILATNETDNLKIQTARRFEIIQQDYILTGSSIYQDQIKVASDIMRYLITPEQLTIFNSLDLKERTQFILNFWKDKDPTPNSKKNEYLEDIQQRYHFANEHFSWGKSEGWASDRGRVLFVYGYPDETIQKYSDPETAPYEIWIYRKDRRYEFVFADLKSIGNFILVHSTKENEIHNEQWPDLVNKI